MIPTDQQVRDGLKTSKEIKATAWKDAFFEMICGEFIRVGIDPEDRVKPFDRVEVYAIGDDGKETGLHFYSIVVRVEPSRDEAVVHMMGNSVRTMIEERGLEAVMAWR